MSAPTQVITDLRREILDKLDAYIYLTVAQCLRLIPKRGAGKYDTWEGSMKRALHLSEQAGLITHGQIYEERRNKRSGFATRRFVYFLTRPGAERLQQLRNVPTDHGITVPGVPHYQRRPASLAHEVTIVEFRIMLEEALREHPNLKLHWIQKDIRKGTNPDAIFGIENTAKPREKSTHWFFLEVELSRAGNWKGGESQKMRKAARYEEYRRTHEVTKDWPFIGDMRVIFHEETTERMLNVLRHFSLKLPYRFLWVTSKELLKDAGGLAPIFYTPKDYRQAACSFVQLVQ
jgi:hypothetical protein